MIRAKVLLFIECGVVEEKLSDICPVVPLSYSRALLENFKTLHKLLN